MINFLIVSKVYHKYIGFRVVEKICNFLLHIINLYVIFDFENLSIFFRMFFEIFKNLALF